MIESQKIRQRVFSWGDRARYAGNFLDHLASILEFQVAAYNALLKQVGLSTAETAFENRVLEVKNDHCICHVWQSTPVGLLHIVICEWAPADVLPVDSERCRQRYQLEVTSASSQFGVVGQLFDYESKKRHVEIESIDPHEMADWLVERLYVDQKRVVGSDGA